MTEISNLISKWFGGKTLRPRTPALGPREIEVLKIFWRFGELSAQQVLEQISDQSLALSTMQSTLERLYKKQLLTRHKQGRAYFYSAVVSQAVIIGQILQDVSEQLSDGELAPMISGFINFVEEEEASIDQAQLDKLNTITKRSK